MLKQHELIDRLHALDKLFVDLYNYAERERDKIRAGEGNAVYALNSIRNTIGGRYNVIPQAASAIDRLSTQVEELRGDHVEAQEIIAAHKAEIEKLAADDPEFEALMRQRYPVPTYSEAASKASARKYREAAMLALRDNISLRADLAKARALASEQTGG